MEKHSTRRQLTGFLEGSVSRPDPHRVRETGIYDKSGSQQNTHDVEVAAVGFVRDGSREAKVEDHNWKQSIERFVADVWNISIPAQ